MRLSICNEVYEQWPFEKVCASIRRIGYSGIEISPFTLAERPGEISAADRKRYREIIRAHGLNFAGLHWLMVSPKGLHVTTPDRELRERSWRHILELIDLCSDLGEDAVMVFGSPKQRCAVDGLSPAEATRNFTAGLASVASRAEERGVTILVEALPIGQCDVITTLEEAAEIVNQLNSPAVRTMFDTHNAVNETEPHAVLVDRYFDLIRHVHINEMDGRHPGTGNYDFKPVFDILERRGYRHWVSLEVFDFTRGPEKIAEDSLRFIEKEIEQSTA
ncbi:MAG TPA: sugar phosphate isomerase/epimerase family protein [Bryobacteraceae bacterium]|nr:sugar phosphate isomerase/epimerase family protein [Bryobacteraceae bacterium]